MATGIDSIGAGQSPLQPAADAIPLARPAIHEDEIRAVERVLRSGRLVMGPEIAYFESRLAEVTGRKHALCVSSGTTALELCLWALSEVRAGGDGGRPPGSLQPREVLVPAAGFPAAVNAIARTSMKVVAVDIDPHTWTMDAGAAALAVTDNTFALVSVDTFGQVAEPRALEALAEDAGLQVIDDAACSLGGFAETGAAGGGYGVVATLSFHPRKVITTGEGGAVLCDDDELAACVAQLRNQGQASPGEFTRTGMNGRMSEMAAAMGACQLDRLVGAVTERRLLVRGYHERLADLRASGRLRWQEWPKGARPAHQTFAVMLSEGGREVRDEVRARLRDRGIEAGVAGFCVNRLPGMCAAMPWLAKARFPVAEALHDRGLALPLYSGMRSNQLDRVTQALAEALS